MLNFKINIIHTCNSKVAIYVNWLIAPPDKQIEKNNNFSHIIFIFFTFLMSNHLTPETLEISDPNS